MQAAGLRAILLKKIVEQIVVQLSLYIHTAFIRGTVRVIRGSNCIVFLGNGMGRKGTILSSEVPAMLIPCCLLVLPEVFNKSNWVSRADLLTEN